MKWGEADYPGAMAVMTQACQCVGGYAGRRCGFHCSRIGGTTAKTCEDSLPRTRCVLVGQGCSCAAEEWRSQSATFMEPQVCSALDECADDQFESVAPTASSDRECLPLTICETCEADPDYGTCVPEYVSTEATPYKDRACTPYVLGCKNAAATNYDCNAQMNKPSVCEFDLCLDKMCLNGAECGLGPTCSGPALSGCALNSASCTAVAASCTAAAAATTEETAACALVTGLDDNTACTATSNCEYTAAATTDEAAACALVTGLADDSACAATSKCEYTAEGTGCAVESDEACDFAAETAICDCSRTGFSGDRCEVKEARTVALDESTVSFSGIDTNLFHSLTGQTIEMEVILNDQFGVPRFGSEDVTAVVRDTANDVDLDGVSVTAQFRGAGMYLVSVTVESTGEFSIAVVVNDADANLFGFTFAAKNFEIVSVAGATTAADSTVTSPETVRAGTDFSCALVGRDVGGLETADTDVKMLWEGDVGAVPETVGDVGFTFTSTETLSITKAGPLVVTFQMLSGEEVSRTTIQIVAGPISAANTVVSASNTGFGMTARTAADLTAGDSISVYVSAKDIYGNSETSGTASFSGSFTDSLRAPSAEVVLVAGGADGFVFDDVTKMYTAVTMITRSNGAKCRLGQCVHGFYELRVVSGDTVVSPEVEPGATYVAPSCTGSAGCALNTDETDCDSGSDEACVFAAETGSKCSTCFCNRAVLLRSICTGPRLGSISPLIPKLYRH